MHESGLSDRHKGDGRARDFWPDFDLKRLAKQLKAGKLRTPMLPRSRLYVWLIRASTSILLWTCVIQLTALGEFWHFKFPKGWPSCHDHRDHFVSEIEHVHVPRRIYKNNGYLMVSCNGGLNQMRAAICDMVAIASYMNVTLIVPELDKTSFWADQSDFNDIFDVRHFIDSLRDELRILRALPEKFNTTHNAETIFTMPPVSWSDSSYYINQILPLVKKHKVLHLNRTDARLANNGLPLEIQKLRCRVNYHALRFTPQIEELGQKLVKTLQARGPFIALHLRYEMDMLAFSGCTHGCKRREANQLTRMRYAYPWWKEKIIDSVQKRKDGLCPLTPKETALILKALGFEKNMQIYIAAGEIYGGEKRMAPLRSAFPNIVRKEMLLSPEDLRPFQNHSSQMAALDYMVSLASNVFIPTYDGNMAKVVEGHRRYLGFRKTLLLDRKNLIGLLDQYAAGALQWDDFTLAVRHLHHDKVGAPAERKVFPERPKEEDYFYANPQECLSYSSPSEETRENVPSVHTIENLRILAAH